MYSKAILDIPRMAFVLQKDCSRIALKVHRLHNYAYFSGQMRKEKPQRVKTNLHLRNKHRKRYDFPKLIESFPALAPFVSVNDYNDKSINFFDPIAVKTLNQALLKLHYGIEHWEIPAHYLSPPIPGRADYIHYVADLLENTKPDSTINCLDIGVGSNCIYPIIGVQEYGWNFVGADIDPVAVESANKIVHSNNDLKGKIEIRLQKNRTHFFKGIVQENEKFDVAICNPPFHVSADAAKKATMRKLKNLKKNKVGKPVLNFGGQHNELWYLGGEKNFVTKMIQESKSYKNNCKWFTALISTKVNLGKIYKELEIAKVPNVKTIPMGTGNKISRIVAWSF